MKDKLKAFLTHLAISGIIAGLAMIVVFYAWYPSPLHSAVGVTKIFLIVLAVDITIGPIITFIVYKKGKKTLKFDLTVVALLQLSALVYGMHTVFIGRPTFVVFNVDRFSVARDYEIDTKSLEKAEKEHNASATVSWFQPSWIGAVGSKDLRRKNEITWTSILAGVDWPQLPELYVPLDKVKDQMLKQSKPLAELRKLHNKENEVQTLLAAWKDDEVKWLPLKAPISDGVVLIDAKTAVVIKALDIKPWP